MDDKINTVLAARVAEDEAVFKSLAEGLVISDHEGRVVLINPVASRMLGWTAQEALGQLAAKVAPIKWQKGKEESILSVSFAALRKKSDYYLVTKTGTEFLAAISASSIILDGKVVGTVMVFRDETEQQETMRAESDFVAITSHSLRTPLGSMKWNLEMLAAGEMGGLPIKAHRMILEVLESNEKMIMLVNDLLTVSRITARHLLSRPEVTDLTVVIRKAAEEVLPLAKERKVDVHVVEGSFLPVAYLDPRHFFEVVVNLLSNGVKYNVPGGKVEVSLNQSPAGILLKVTDTGMGISLPDQKRLFQMFFRSDGAIERETEGTGLGLYVVSSYVQLWGGKVWCESKPDNGATFFVEIPWKQSENNATL